MRTHFCGELTKANLNEDVTLCGWVNRRRDHGGVIFLDVRDKKGISQVVINPDTADTFKLAETIRNEFVLQITGKVLARDIEMVNNKIPGFRNIYNALKKISSTVLNTSSDSFRKAFLIQYPSKGIWVIAFQSGDYEGEVKKIIGEDVINLFVPTTPNPTSGFFVMMPKKDAYELQMSAEEAFKLVISAGVVTPENLKIKGKK